MPSPVITGAGVAGRRTFLTLGAMAAAGAGLAAAGGRALQSRFSAAQSRAQVRLPAPNRPLPPGARADLDQAAAASADNAAALAFNGPDQGLDTIGGQVAFQVGAFGLVVVGLMNLLMVGRLTRGEEEAGRTELIRALRVGRHAPAVGALAVVAGMNAVVGILVALGLLSQDLPSAGSLVFGASYTALGLVFAGVAAVAAQVTENTRVVYGIAGAVLGASFVLRAAGDVGDGTLSWLSPIGPPVRR